MHDTSEVKHGRVVIRSYNTRSYRPLRKRDFAPCTAAKLNHLNAPVERTHSCAEQTVATNHGARPSIRSKEGPHPCATQSRKEHPVRRARTIVQEMETRTHETRGLRPEARRRKEDSPCEPRRPSAHASKSGDGTRGSTITITIASVSTSASAGRAGCVVVAQRRRDLDPARRAGGTSWTPPKGSS